VTLEDGRVLVVDTETGEILDQSDRVGTGELVSSPQAARGEDELLESSAKHRRFSPNHPVHRNAEFILALLSDGTIHLALARALNWIIDNIQIRNYLFTSTSAIGDALGLKKDLVSRYLRDLESKNMVRIVARNRTRRGTILIQVNPVYGYRGYAVNTPEGTDTTKQTLVESYYRIGEAR
jgi:hypothetical protein